MTPRRGAVASASTLCWALAVPLLLAPLSVRAWRLLATDRASRAAQLADFVVDDSYYYLQIARNFANTGLSTADGVTATNGYHPLWMLALSALSALVGSDSPTLFSAACLLLYAVALSSTQLGCWSADASSRSLARALAAGLVTAMLQQWMTFLAGMETVLLLPLMSPLISRVERARTARDDVALSAILSMFFLVRIDTLALFASTVVVLS